MINAKSRMLYFLLLFTSCNIGVQTDDMEANPKEVLQDLLDESLTGSGNNNPGTSMTVISHQSNLKGDLGWQLHWTGKAGYDSLEKTDSLEADQPFRIASVTKTYVAATILKMEEEGLLSLADPITTYIDSSFTDMLVEDGYLPERIAIHHCLTHTSGLFNYAQGTNSYLERVLNDPKKVWDRNQQLQHAIEYGDPVGTPGEVYHYSDTGYILLGNIIENITDNHYGVAMRSLLQFNELNLETTWLERIEAARVDTSAFVKRYFRDKDCSHIDPSADLFGGGGFISTTNDLAMFLHALFNDKIFDKSHTLETMIAKTSYGANYEPAEDKKYLDYRKGFYQMSFYGMDAYVHSGFWGTVFLHIPEINTTVAADAINGSTDRLVKKTILYLMNLQKQKG